MNEIVKDDDADKGLQFQEIFVELGLSHLKEIVAQETIIPDILLSLLGIPELGKTSMRVMIGV